MTEPQWDVPQPFTLKATISAEHIDDFGHANNRVYLDLMEQVAWAHSEALGMDIDRYRALNTAVAVQRHELDYIQQAFVDDQLLVGTWLSENDGRLRMQRRFQMCRVADGKTLFRGLTDFIVIELSSGRPKRMPEAFKQAYRVSQALGDI